MKVILTVGETEWLLYDLCVKLGFCLPPPLMQRIINNPPPTIDRFVSVIYKGEGLKPELKSALYKQVYDMVAKAFEKHEQSEDNQTV
jgi:hypothetical protein